MIVYNSNKPTSEISPVDMTKEEMVKIAESMMSASMIISVSEVETE